MPPGVDRIEPVEPVTIVQGSLVTLSCEARGVPPPTLTWLKDGQPLSLHRNLLLDGRETRLQLPDVAPSDAGLYSCVASNQAGSSTKTFNLTVLGNHTQTCVFPDKDCSKLTTVVTSFICRASKDDQLQLSRGGHHRSEQSPGAGMLSNGSATAHPHLAQRRPPLGTKRYRSAGWTRCQD